MQAVFDGHNDVLLRLWQNARKGSDPVAEFVEGTDKGHIDAPRSKAGGLIGGLCAIYVPSGDLVLAGPDENGHYVTPLLGTARAFAVARRCRRDGRYCGSSRPRRCLEALPVDGGDPRCSRAGHFCIRSAHGRLRSHWCRSVRTRNLLRRWPAFAWTGVEPPQRLCPRRALCLPDVARYGAWPDRGRLRTGEGVQPLGHPDRSRPHHREGLLGCRQDERPAAGCQPFERPCADGGCA